MSGDICTTLSVKPLRVKSKNTPYIVLKHNIPRVFNYARGNARKFKKNEKL